MKLPLITLIVFSIEHIYLFSINGFIGTKKGALNMSLIGIGLLTIGLIVKRINSFIDYHIFILPALQIGLMLLSHLFFQTVFKQPYYINLRGWEYPKELKTDTSGFTELLHSLVSIGIICTLYICLLLM